MAEDERVSVEEVQDRDSSVENVETFRRQLIHVILNLLVVLGGIAVVVSGVYDYVNQNLAVIPFYVGAYLFFLVVAFWKKSTYALQTGTFLVILFGLGCLNYYYFGLSGEGHVFMLAFAFFTSVFWGRVAGIGVLVVAAEVLGVFGWAYATGRLVVPPSVQANVIDPLAWLSGGTLVVILGVLANLAQSYLLLKLSDALGKSQELTQHLNLRQNQLHKLVEERTEALERRSVQLATAAQVARETSAIRDLDRLLRRVVNLISRRFGYYHAGVFFLDATEEYAELRAASSEGGQRMLAQGHRLRVGETGVVGYVARHGEARIARDVGEDAVHFDNPELPETRSEVALPLQTRERVIGVLDVQSKHIDAFGEEDVLVLQTLVDQIALVISNVQLVREIERRLEAERRAYGEVSRAGWQDLLKREKGLGFTRDQLGLNVAEDIIDKYSLRVMRTGETAMAEEKGTVVAVPVRVRGQIVGVINARKAAESGSWSTDERELLMQLGEQIGLALENARLYQETRRRAAQEQLVSEVTTQMRASLNLDDVLAATVRELGQHLALDEVVLQLVDEESPVIGG